MARNHPRPLPPCPDPERYIAVHTREGSFWRLRRGLGKPAVLNEAMSRQADRVRQCSPAAARLVQSLRPYLSGMQPGRLTARIGGQLGKGLKERGFLDCSGLPGMDLQPDYPIDRLLRGTWRVDRLGVHTVQLTIPALAGGRVRPKSRLVTGYRLSAVLVSGDLAGEAPLETDCTHSRLYPVGEGDEEDCVLLLALPEPGVPWLLCLKVACQEGADEGVHPGLKGMKIVAAGQGS